MNFPKLASLLLLISAIILHLGGCADTEPADGDGDSDGDTDSDGDGDSDGDTDSDGDGDSDGDSDGDTDGDSDGDCDDDTFEDGGGNDAEASATPITEGDINDLRLCPGDEDYYSVALAVGDEITVELAFVHAEGDASLYLLAPDGSEAASSTTATDDEMVNFTASVSGRYIIRAVLEDEADSDPGLSYGLSIDVNEAVQTCDDDPFEDNDGPSDATDVDEGDYSGLRVCLGDADYYSIQLGVNDTLEVELTFANSEGNIDVSILNPFGTELAVGNSNNNDELVSYTATAAGFYDIRVSLLDDAGAMEGNEYDMSIAIVTGTTTCEDDGFENNDTDETAVDVAEGDYTDLRLCPGDDDYYAIELAVDEELTVDVLFSHAEGDIELYLLNPYLFEVASSESTDDDEGLTYVAQTAGTYVVWVVLYDDTGSSEGNDYEMSINVSESTSACIDDGLEDNDSLETASDITAGDYPGLHSCDGDDDYFAIELGVGDAIEIDLAFSHSEGDVDVRLLDSSETIVSTSASASDDEHISYEATEAGTYYIFIYLYSDRGTIDGNGYDMTITINGEVPTCDDDSFENNDTIATAEPVSEGPFTGLRLCPSDDDFYAIDLAIGDEITVDLTFSDGEGDIDLVLLNPIQSVVASSSSLTDNESVTYTAARNGTFYIRAILAEDAGSVEGNVYNMNIEVTEAIPTCDDDGFENNDVYENPAPIADGSYSDLRACPQDDDYYSIELGVGDELDVEVTFNHSDGDIDMVLIDPDGDVVETAFSETDDETLSHTAAAGGTYVILVYGYLEDIPGGNGYDMVIDHNPATPTCTDDSFENNDTLASAVAVGAGSYPGLRFCIDDDDYFEIDLGLDDELTVDLTFSHASGDIDVQLFDPNGTLVDFSVSETNNESISHVATVAGTYTLWVYGNGIPPVGTSYDMDIDLIPATPTCDDDGYEDNDTRATALPVSTGTHERLRLCLGDEDYYSIGLGIGDELNVDLIFTHAEGDIDLQLYNAAGSRVASSTSVDSNESISYTAPAAGTYYIRAWLYRDAGSSDGNDYDMEIERIPAVPTCDDDGYEDNDTQATATDADDGTYSSLRICSGDDDFYSIFLGVGDELNVALTFTHAEGDIDVRLLNEAGNTVTYAVSTTNNESMSYTATTAGTYTIRVYLLTDLGSASGNDYNMSIDHIPATPVCAEDDFEDNDTQATAVPIEAGTHADLRICQGDDDFYSFSLAVGDVLAVTLLFSDAEGDLDLRLLNASGTTVASSGSLTDNESLSYTATVAGTYTIRAYLFADSGGALGNDYDMTIVHTPVTPVCTDDAFEENDSQADAVPITHGEYEDLRICTDDDDYYEIYLPAGAEITVDVVFTDAEGDIDLRLLNAAGTAVASSTSILDYESIDYTVTTAGTYTIRLDLFADAGSAEGNSYDMTITVTGVDDPCSNDGYEENDSQAAAASIYSGFFPALWVCPTDEDDYYDVDLRAGDQLEVNLYFYDDEGDIDMSLLNAGGGWLAGSVSSDDNEQLTYTASADGVYTIHVELYSDAGSVAGNTYDMDVWTNLANGCAQDGFEDNDTRGDAPLIDVGYYNNLWVCPTDEDDYYDVWLEAGVEVEIYIQFWHSEGNINAQLLNAAGTVVASGSSTTDHERLWYTPQSDGYYTVHVELVSDAGTTTGNLYLMDIVPL